MPPLTLTNSSYQPTYGHAASGNLPTSISEGRLQLYIDKMTAAIAPLQETVPLSAKLFGKAKNIVNVGGGRGFPIQDGISTGILHRNPMASPIMPEFNPYELAFARVDVRAWYASASFSGLYLARAENSRSSAEFMADTLDGTMRQLMNTLIDDDNMKLLQDGRGILGIVAADVTSTSVTCHHWYDSAGLDIGGATYFLRKGMDITFVNNTTGAAVFQTRIANVNFATGVITLAANPGAGVISDGFFIVRGDSNGHEYNLCRSGVYAPFMATSALGGAGSYLGVAYVDQPSWAPMVFGNSGVLRPYHPNLIVQAMTYADNEWGMDNGSVDVLLSTSEVWYEHFQHAQNVVQYTTFDAANETKIKAPVFSAGGRPIPWLTSRYSVPNHIVGINTDSFERLTDKEFQFQKTNGSALVNVPGTDSYFLWGKGYGEWFCRSPRMNFIVTDIQTSGLTIRK